MAFRFTKLVVGDLETALRFYADVFGMRALHRVGSDAHSYALDEVVMASGDGADGHRLLFVRYRDRPCPPAGACWTGFMVDDIDAVLLAAQSAGGRVEVPVHDNAEHGVRAAILADPAGHLIEVVQMIGAEG